MNYNITIKIIAKLASIGEIIKKIDVYFAQRSISLNETLRPYMSMPVR